MSGWRMCESAFECRVSHRRSICNSLPTDHDKVEADLGNGSNLHLAQWHLE